MMMITSLFLFEPTSVISLKIQDSPHPETLLLALFVYFWLILTSEQT